MNPQLAVTWIQVKKPTFDLAGVLISSLSLTGIMAGIALVLGIVLGVALIRRRRREEQAGFDSHVGLHLQSPTPQA